MKVLSFSNTNITLNDTQVVYICQATTVIYSGLVGNLVVTSYNQTVATVTAVGESVVILLT